MKVDLVPFLVAVGEMASQMASRAASTKLSSNGHKAQILREERGGLCQALVGEVVPG